MKSKQINFFISPDDWEAINHFFIDHGACFIKQPIHDLKNMLTTDISTKEDGDFNKVFLTKAEYISSIKTRYLETQNYYLVDDLRSNVVEFSRGGFSSVSNDALERARLYFVSQYFEDEITVKKDTSFLSWAESLLLSFKKQFLTNRILSYGMSNNVFQWMRENNKSIEDSGLIIK
jgi:hypothetical protein